MTNIQKGLLFLTSLATIHSYSATNSYYAVVLLPKTTVVIGEPITEPIVESNDPSISVLKSSTSSLIGTFTVNNDELNSTTLISSKEGCSVEIDSADDGSSGSWTYINDNSCSDDDAITFTTKSGVDQLVSLWGSGDSCDSSNDWLNAAKGGYVGLEYNGRSCTINNSTILSLGSFQEVPAQYLRGVDISLFSGVEGGGEGGEGGGESPEGSEGEGEVEGVDKYYFLLPDVNYIWNGLSIDHPFLTQIDLSNLQYVGGNLILSNLHQIESLDIRNLRYYTEKLTFSHSFGLSYLNLSRLQNAGEINISYTSITDISNFQSLQNATIISNDIVLTHFPSKYTTFCNSIRSGNVEIIPYNNWNAAYNACRL